MTASGHIERPVYQAMNVGGAKDGEIMVEGDLERFVRIPMFVDHFDPVQEPLVEQLAMHVGEFCDRIRFLRRPARMIPE